jgi:rhomboid protease GluP
MTETIYRVQKRRGLFSFNLNLLLIIINVVCFILFSILISINSNFLDYIALKPSNIITNFYFWTFLTSMFMHAGFLHLFVNMFSMLFVGNLVERIIGKRRFLSLYLLSGLFAGMFFVLISLFFPSENVYAVGASGAIFGLLLQCSFFYGLFLFSEMFLLEIQRILEDFFLDYLMDFI